MRAREGKYTETICQKFKSCWVTEPVQVVATDLMGPISPAALLGNSSYTRDPDVGAYRPPRPQLWEMLWL